MDRSGDGPVVYDGISPVTAILPFGNGVLVAFSNSGGNPNSHGIVWNPNWTPADIDLGQGVNVYSGISPVKALLAYNGGILAAFSNVAGNPDRYSIVWNPDWTPADTNLGIGVAVYDGISPVTAIASFNGGVLTAFSNAAGNPNRYRIHWSPDGQNLGEGPVVYDGTSPVTAIASVNGGVVTAFSNILGNSQPLSHPLEP